MLTDKDEIIRKVKSIISKVLRVDEQKIELSSSLIRDLGAESIDFLDITFNLESSFNIRIPKGELFPEKILTDAQYVENGHVTLLGINELRKKIPEVDWNEFSKNPRVSEIGNFFTVKTVVNYLEKKLVCSGK